MGGGVGWPIIENELNSMGMLGYGGPVPQNRWKSYEFDGQGGRAIPEASKIDTNLRIWMSGRTGGPRVSENVWGNALDLYSFGEGEWGQVAHKLASMDLHGFGKGVGVRVAHNQ